MLSRKIPAEQPTTKMGSERVTNASKKAAAAMDVAATKTSR